MFLKQLQKRTCGVLSLYKYIKLDELELNVLAWPAGNSCIGSNFEAVAAAGQLVWLFRPQKNTQPSIDMPTAVPPPSAPSNVGPDGEKIVEMDYCTSCCASLCHLEEIGSMSSREST